MASRLAPHLLRADGEPATFKDLAAAAMVSPATLKHYFGDRTGVVAAVTEAFAVDAQPHLADMAAVAAGSTVEESLTGVLLGFTQAWRQHGAGTVISGGLAVGLGHHDNGPAVVEKVLEPLLRAMERRLEAHVARGDLPVLPVRESAISVVAPVLLALIHQDGLGGSSCRHLDVEDFTRTHVRTIVRGLRAG